MASVGRKPHDFLECFNEKSLSVNEYKIFLYSFTATIMGLRGHRPQVGLLAQNPDPPKFVLRRVFVVPTC